METGLLKVGRIETYKILNQVNSYLTPERDTWIKASMENEEFEISKQWNQNEVDINQERGNYVITINVIERMIEYITGMLTAKLPEYAIYAKNKGKESSTKLGKKLLSWVFEENRGLMKVRQLVHDGLVANVAYLFIHADEEGNIKISNLDYSEVVIDPGSKDSTYEDAKAIFIKRKIAVADAKVLYGIGDMDTGFPDEYESLRQNVGSSTINPGDTTLTYDYNNTEIFRLFSTDETYMDIYERYTKQLVKEDGKLRTRIVKEILLGYDYIVRELLPASIDKYPLTSFFYKNTKNPYKIGKIHLVKEIQRFINKIHGLILKNTLTLGSPKVFAETTAIPNGNIDAFKQSLSDPNGLVLLNPSMDGREQIKTVQASPAPPAPMELYANALRIMEFNTAPSEMIGMSNSNTANASNSILQKESVLDSFKTMSGVMEDSLERLGIIILQYIKAYVKEDAIVFISDGKAAIEKLELNKKHKIDFNNPESIEAFRKNMAESGMSASEVESILIDAKDNEEYAESIQEYIENDTSNIDFFVKIVPGSYASMFDSLKFQTLTMLVQMGAIHPSILIDYAPLEDKEKIKQKSQTIEAAFREMQDMGSQLEQMSKEAEGIKKENEKLKADMVETENKVRMDYLYKDARVKETKQKNELSNSIKGIKTEASNKAKDIIFALKEAVKDMENENIAMSEDEYQAMKDKLDSIIKQSI